MGRHGNIPECNMTIRLVEEFRTTGSVMKRKPPGFPVCVCTPNNIEIVLSMLPVNKEWSLPALLIAAFWLFKKTCISSAAPCTFLPTKAKCKCIHCVYDEPQPPMFCCKNLGKE